MVMYGQSGARGFSTAHFFCAHSGSTICAPFSFAPPLPFMPAVMLPLFQLEA